MTMTPLDWYPKRFSPGDIDGEGARNLLGRPSLHPLATLVRETAQNSWDAALPGQGLTFEMNVRTLSLEQLDLLRSTVFATPGRGTRLVDALAETSLVVLEIHDRGTSGLGGPLRNDIPVAPGTSTDFIDFIFNIGAPRDTEHGGGTYGFGKTISYLASGVDTIIVWSHAEDPGPEGHRLIASAIGDGFDLDGHRYTGRQWWGRTPAGGPAVLPVLGTDADDIGRALFSREFGDGQTGTSIMIVDVGAPSVAPLISEILAEAVVWNLWPKLLEHNGVRAMSAQVLLENRPVRNLDPVRDPRLAPFVASLAAIRDVQAGDQPVGSGFTTVKEINIYSPRAQLGHAALTWQLSPPQLTDDPLADLGDDIAGIRPFEGIPRHIALMRQAELVVRYVEGPAPTVDRVGYGGVFRCLPEVDDAFADAEPPAHDDWEPAGVLHRTHRSYVTVALKRIKDTLREFAIGSNKRPIGTADDTPQRIAARVAADLADLVDRPPERADPPSHRQPPGRKRNPGAPALTAGQPQIAAEGDLSLALVPLELSFSTPVRVVCRAGIGFEGGSEADPAGPRCRGFSGVVDPPPPGTSGRTWVAGETLELQPGDGMRWTAIVELPPGLTAELDFEIAAK